jgi:predicted amidohydrolase YtcJ
VKKKAQELKSGDWILGAGWDEDRWPEPKLPSAADLDAVAPHHPVFLSRIDTHAAWVNSLALKLAQIDRSTPDREGGKIYRNPQGDPTGILLDIAMQQIYDILPHPTLEETVEITQKILHDCLRKGITSIHNAATFENDLNVFKTLAHRQTLPLRVYAMVVMPDQLGESFLKNGMQNYGPFFEVRCIKLFIDGAMGSRGAALMEPYCDDPGNKGLLLWDEKTLLPILKQAKEKGFQVAIHAIGDLGAHLVLNAYEKIGVQGLRWRMEHAQLLKPEDIERFHSLGIIAAIQPMHATEDMRWIADRIGEERCKKGAFLWRSFLDHGIVLTGGSDAPVVDDNPLWGIYAAITRQDFEGNPKEGWYPDQRMTPLEALQMYTINAAYAAYREKELGSIKQGKLADLVVLPKNLLTCDPKDLIDMQVLYTIINGKVGYQTKEDKRTKG